MSWRKYELTGRREFNLHSRVPDLWTDLLGCLDPHRASDSADTDVAVEFDGVAEWMPPSVRRTIARTIRPGRVPDLPRERRSRSLHMVFVREGRANEPSRTGRPVARGPLVRLAAITAHQPHAVLASAAVSLHGVRTARKTKTANRFRRCWMRRIVGRTRA